MVREIEQGAVAAEETWDEVSLSWLEKQVTINSVNFRVIAVCVRERGRQRWLLAAFNSRKP